MPSSDPPSSPAPERPLALAALPPGYGPLFDLARAYFWSDERVRALWIGGALARGAADAGSDLDLVVTVDDAAFDTFAATWRDWLAEITLTLIAREIPGSPGSFYAVTDDWERLDVVSERASALPETHYRIRIPVFDRDGLAARLPAYVPLPISKEHVERLIEEFFRIHGLLPAVVARGDWLLGVEGVHTLRTLLYELFVAGNPPLPPMGIKQWSSKLAEEQRLLLERLPVGAATREDVIAGHVALARAFVPAARELAARLDIPWPERLEHRTADHLRRELGVESWLSSS